MDDTAWIWIGVFILVKLFAIWRCLARCHKHTSFEGRVHDNPELGQGTVPTPVEGLPPGHYLYNIESETNWEVPPPPYTGTRTE